MIQHLDHLGGLEEAFLVFALNEKGHMNVLVTIWHQYRQVSVRLLWKLWLFKQLSFTIYYIGAHILVSKVIHPLLPFVYLEFQCFNHLFPFMSHRFIAFHIFAIIYFEFTLDKITDLNFFFFGYKFMTVIFFT